MSITVYKKTLITSGVAAALDSIDGDLLLDGDYAFVTVSNVNYVYILDDDLGGGESSPTLIKPDTNPGNKMWVLQNQSLSVLTGAGDIPYASAAAVPARLAAGATTKILVGGGAAAPVWTEATGTGAPVRAGTPSFTTGIGIGGVAAGTGGVAFPASAVAVADANTLDDYEEGTWTPTIVATAITYTTQIGLYVKIGSRVYIYGYIKIATITPTAGALALIMGIPFQPVTNTCGQLTASTSGLPWPAGCTMIIGMANSDNTAILLVGTYNDGAYANIITTNAAATDELMIAGFYSV